MHKPIIPLTLAYITGLLLGHRFLYFPYTISITVLLGLLIAIILIQHDKPALRRALRIPPSKSRSTFCLFQCQTFGLQTLE